jgi:ribosomal protein S18 acetylase RimI-like enzyme
LISKLASGRHTSGIRSLNPSRDLGQLADLIESAFGQELSDGGEQVLREIRLLSRLGPLNYLFTEMSSEIDGLFNSYVWEEEGRVVGNVTVNRPTGHPQRWQISNVAVLDPWRGRGIGRKLVEAALDQIVRRGGQAAYLFVRDDNPSAGRLYEGLGFVRVDAATDLKLDPPPRSGPSADVEVLRSLRPEEGEALYQLVSRAAGPGYRWLYAIRRRQYVLSAEERFSRWLESLFTGQAETRWCLSTAGELDAGVSLRATRLWNRKPHILHLWVRPDRRGQVEKALARDIAALLSRQAPRSTRLSLPECECAAIEALLEQGFTKVRTLVLMRLDV